MTTAIPSVPGMPPEHQVIVCCKQHPEMEVIQAIDVIFKNETK